MFILIANSIPKAELKQVFDLNYNINIFELLCGCLQPIIGCYNQRLDNEQSQCAFTITLTNETTLGRAGMLNRNELMPEDIDAVKK